MSNTETQPVELRCGSDGVEPAVDVLAARSVPLGGPRAMMVHRTLPQRRRTLIGAWCFADHYGPQNVRDTGGMRVAPHPHTGLQTVSWLFSGEIEHRDSSGVHAMVRPGELNLMTGGHGICHSEVSTEATRTLHGVQLWVALPAENRDAPRDFRHHAPEPIDLGGAVALVFLGSLGGETSPVPTFTPLLGAEITVEPGADCTFAVDPSFEHGVLVDLGAVEVSSAVEVSGADERDGRFPLQRTELGYLAPGAARLRLTNPTSETARVILLGGPPFGEDIVMWWNFVGRSHEDIVRFRQAWQEESARFGAVDGYEGTPSRLPAPALPHARLTPRRNPR